MRQFVYLAPSAKTRTGHDEVYLESVRHVCANNNMEMHTYLPLDTAIPTSLGTRFFSAALWKRVKEFTTIFSKHSGKDTCFFIEQFSLKELLALSCAAQTLSTSQKLIVLFRKAYTSRIRKAMASLAHLLLSRSRGQCTYVCDSGRIAARLEPLFTQPVTVLPIPHVRTTTAHGQIDLPYILWWPGKPKVEKGWEELQSLAQRLPHEAVTLWASEEAVLPHTIRLPKHLTEQEYDDAMMHATAVLLPYDAATYETSTSGIFVEAVCAGKIPLVRRGSWLAYELERYNLSECILDWSSQTLLEDILARCASKSIREKCTAMQQTYRTFHNLNTFTARLSKHLLQPVKMDL